MSGHRKTSIEVRIAQLVDGRLEFDEVVAANAHVHLEKMTDQLFALIVETATERACFHIHTKNGKAHVDACEVWREPK